MSREIVFLEANTKESVSVLGKCLQNYCICQTKQQNFLTELAFYDIT